MEFLDADRLQPSERGVSVMSIFLIIVGILGILVSLLTLYQGALYIAAQWRYERQARVSPQTVWRLSTVPALSTILLFVLQHWIFTIVIILAIIQMVLKALRGEHGAERILLLVSEFLGAIIIVFGAAIILTLSLTSQNADNATLLSWYFPVLIVAFGGVSWVANLIFSWFIGALARLVSR